MQIVRADLACLEELTLLFDAYRQFYQQASDLLAARDYLEQRLMYQEAVVFMAKNEQQAYGFTLLYHHWSSVAMGHVWLLNDLYVKPEARRQGIAEALMQEAVDFARLDRAKRIWLRTAVDNTTAQALYEKMGFVRDETFYRYDLIL